MKQQYLVTVEHEFVVYAESEEDAGDAATYFFDTHLRDARDPWGAVTNVTQTADDNLQLTFDF